MEIELKENERIDDLEFKGLKIIQNTKGFCFGIDAVLLSDFSKNIKKNAKVLDLGTGTGIISILLCGKTNLEKIVGVEVQEEVADMAKRSSRLNNLENKFEIINENIINLDKIFVFFYSIRRKGNCKKIILMQFLAIFVGSFMKGNPFLNVEIC